MRDVLNALKLLAVVWFLGLVATCGASCQLAHADMGSDVSQLVRELAGIRRALESGKCGGR